MADDNTHDWRSMLRFVEENPEWAGGMVRVPHIAALRLERSRFRDEPDPDRDAGRLSLRVEVDEEASSMEVTPAQAAAVESLLASRPDWVDQLDAAVAEYALSIRDDYRAEYAAYGDAAGFDAMVPADMKPADARGRYSVGGVTILDIEKDGLAYALLNGGCVWDEEHGIGITLHGTRVVGVDHATETADAAYAEADE